MRREGSGGCEKMKIIDQRFCFGRGGSDHHQWSLQELDKMGQKKRLTSPSQIAKTDGLLSASDLLSKSRNLAPVWVRYSRVHGKVAFSSPSHLAVIDNTCDEYL